MFKRLFTEIQSNSTTLSETLSTAIKSLIANKARSALTMLGVIIGVFSVVMMISLGQGVKNYITDEFDALGSNLIFVSPGSVSFGGDPATAFSRNYLDEKHTKLIETYAGEHVSVISPYHLVGSNVSFKSNEYFGEIVGVSSEGVDILNYPLTSGTKFTQSQVRSSDRVAIIGPVIKDELFKSLNPVGQRLKIGGDSYTVIGTFKEKGSNYDDQILLPYTSAEKTFEIKNYSSIVTQVDNAENVSVAMRQIELALLRDLKEEDFTVLSQSDILETIQTTLGTLTLALGIIAGISLVVGGIGIMNIMLVSVTERIREIGLRKALGATSKIVALQFLVESVVLSVVGGFFGLLLGFVGTLIAQQFFRAEIPGSAIILSFGFSVFVGVVFGTYPAINASKRDAIESLRYE